MNYSKNLQQRSKKNLRIFLSTASLKTIIYVRRTKPLLSRHQLLLVYSVRFTDLKIVNHFLLHAKNRSLKCTKLLTVH